MDPAHEAVEMQALMRQIGEAADEEIHEHGLAAANRAPEIKPAHGRPAPAQPPEQTDRLRSQSSPKRLQPFQGRELSGIGPQPTALDRLPIERAQLS